MMSSFQIDHPFADRLNPSALDLITHLGCSGLSGAAQGAADFTIDRIGELAGLDLSQLIKPPPHNAGGQQEKA